MRLLDHPADWYWYDKDPASYQAETNRMQQEYDKQWSKHMSQFPHPYKLTKQELEARIEIQESQCKGIKRLNAPKELIDEEQRKMDELLTIYGNRDWLQKQGDKLYRNAYEKAESEFYFKFKPRIPQEVVDYIRSKGEKI